MESKDRDKGNDKMGIRIIALTVLAALTTACGPIASISVSSVGMPSSRVDFERRQGPPPHAPAHGHRHKQKHTSGSDVDLVFDSGLGVYVVVDAPNRYYWNGYYLRIDGGEWYASVDLDSSGWKRAGESNVPPGLHGKHHKANKHHKAKKSHKNKRSSPAKAKGRW